MFDTRVFIWTATRVILGMALPPAVAASVYCVIGILYALVLGSLNLTPKDTYEVFRSSYYLAILPSFMGSLVMEMAGRLLFRTAAHYTRQQKLIYVGIGTIMGALVAAYIIIPAGNWFDGLALFLIATGLIAGLLMSLLFLQLWKREMKPQVVFSDL